MELRFSGSTIKRKLPCYIANFATKNKNLKRAELHNIYNLEKTNQQKQPGCRMIGIKQKLKKKILEKPGPFPINSQLPVITVRDKLGCVECDQEDFLQLRRKPERGTLWSRAFGPS